jgi:hypothetical protein
VSDDLYATEVLGLQFALARSPVMIALELRRLNGNVLQCELPFADELSALVLKSFATKVRFKDTDIVDIWRCLEIALAVGLGPTDFIGGVRADVAEIIRTLFSTRDGTAMTAITAAQHLSKEAADQRFTRIQALMAHILGPA